MATPKESVTNFQFRQIGIAETPYKEKFAIPRQSGLVPEVKGRIKLCGEYNSELYIRGLEQFSHLWVLFIFHQHLENAAKPLVRPPRLGGNKKIGVFASRSTFRPNPIGMSAVKLEGCYQHQGQQFIVISGADLLDQTPIVDIKPYIAYSDIITDSDCGYAEQPPEKFAINFADQAIQQLELLKPHHPELQQIIVSILQQNPAPAYHQSANKEYGVNIYDLNIQWRVQEQQLLVTQISEAKSK